MFSSNCGFLTCIQVSQEAGQVVWYPHLFQNFPQFILIHTVEGFGVVNKAEIDVFLELSCFFDDPVDVGNLISGSSAFSKTSLNICKFSVHILLKPGLENFEHYFASVWNECNCVVVWAFFGIAFLRDWNGNWPFPVLWPLLSFPNLLKRLSIAQIKFISSSPRYLPMRNEKLRWNKTCMWVLLSTSFIITKNGNNPNMLQVVNEETHCVSFMQCNVTQQQKRKRLLVHTITWIHPKGITLKKETNFKSLHESF